MLELTKLFAAYDGESVLQGVDLTVAPGEIKALMGRNGMGKTTLLRTIIGLLRPQSGEIRFDGTVINDLAAHELARHGLGYIPQGREIFASFSVLENLRLGALRFPRSERSVPDEIFAYFPILSERRHQKAGTLSGGEQQMLAIARALIGKPKMLLLDEPSEGIQPSIVEAIGGILARINAQSGLTILLVEQNVRLVLELASSCAFMEKGRIADVSSITDIKKDDSMLLRYVAI